MTSRKTETDQGEVTVVPRNPDFEAVIRESFGRQAHMATLGVSIEGIAPGECDLRLPYSPAFCQQNGYMHAGAIASVADSANGYAAYSLAPPGDGRARRGVQDQSAGARTGHISSPG